MSEKLKTLDTTPFMIQIKTVIVHEAIQTSGKHLYLGNRSLNFEFKLHRSCENKLLPTHETKTDLRKTISYSHIIQQHREQLAYNGPEFK